METKTCSKCGQAQPIDEFYIRESGARRNECRTCIKAKAIHHYRTHLDERKSWQLAYRKANPRRLRNQYLFKHYGITLEDWERLAVQQNYRCLGCGRHHEELTKGLVVDHNHETGEIRGLLCSNCNIALGQVGDDPTILSSLITYLAGRA